MSPAMKLLVWLAVLFFCVMALGFFTHLPDATHTNQPATEPRLECVPCPLEDGKACCWDENGKPVEKKTEIPKGSIAAGNWQHIPGYHDYAAFTRRNP